jgi:hypothetical protein
MSTRAAAAEKKKTGTSVLKEVTPEAPKAEKKKKITQKVKSSSSTMLASASETGFASAASSSSREIINSIDYCDARDTHRQIVIVPKSGEQFWPVQNIAFFRTSGTSNEGTGWLSGTFYPTSGLTCKHRDTPETIRNYAECVKGNNDHVTGHITKMSDYNTRRIFSLGLIDFMKHLFDGELLVKINSVFPYYPRVKITTAMLSYPGFGTLEGAAQYITTLETVIMNYFLTEEQLKLSYQLTPDNTGLWGFKFGDFSLSEFCRQRWGPLPKFNVPDIEQCRENSDDIYRFIVANNANVDFDDMKSQVLSQIKTQVVFSESAFLTSRIAQCKSNIYHYELTYSKQEKGKGKSKKQKNKSKNNKTKKTKAKKSTKKQKNYLK